MADLSGRPLLETAADARLYAARTVDHDLERYALAGLNVMLVGERGAGKTSTLRQLVRRLRLQGPENAVVFVDGSLLGPEPMDLARAILDAVGRARGLPDRLQRSLPAPFGPTAGRGGESLVEAVRRLRRARPEGARRCIAVLDSLTSPEAPHT